MKERKFYPGSSKEAVNGLALRFKAMNKTRKPSARSGLSFIGKRRKKAKLCLTAISHYSGISHHFTDLDALQALAKSYFAKWN